MSCKFVVNAMKISDLSSDSFNHPKDFVNGLLIEY